MAGKGDTYTVTIEEAHLKYREATNAKNKTARSGAASEGP